MVISDALWKRGFGGEPEVIGRTLRIDDDPYEIIGVTTPDFRHPSLTLETNAEMWAPTGWIASPFEEPQPQPAVPAGSDRPSEARHHD